VAVVVTLAAVIVVVIVVAVAVAAAAVAVIIVEATVVAVSVVVAVAVIAEIKQAITSNYHNDDHKRSENRHSVKPHRKFMHVSPTRFPHSFSHVGIVRHVHNCNGHRMLHIYRHLLLRTL
jgi:hypothetical protein